MRGSFTLKIRMNLPGAGARTISPRHPGSRVPFLIRALIATLVGAALIHVVEYHLGLGIRGTLGQRLAAIEFALYHCPLRGPIGLLALLAAIVIAATLASMRSQLRTLHQLEGALTREPDRPKSLRIDRREGYIPTLAAAWLVLGLAQLGIFIVAQHVAPMEYVMHMHGGQMLMGVALPVSPALLSFLIALPAALLVTRLEARLSGIAAAIAETIRTLFARARSSRRPVPAPARVALSARFGPTVFSRPPPAISSFPG